VKQKLGEAKIHVDRKIHNHYQHNSAFRSQNNACNLTKTTEKRTFHIPSPSPPQFSGETNEQTTKSNQNAQNPQNPNPK
jgi:hypothetical protein